VQQKNAGQGPDQPWMATKTTTGQQEPGIRSRSRSNGEIRSTIRFYKIDIFFI